MKTKQITMDYENVYYPISEREYLIKSFLIFIWDILVLSIAIYLSVTHTAWWMFLVLLIGSSDKIAKRRRD